MVQEDTVQKQRQSTAKGPKVETSDTGDEDDPLEVFNVVCIGDNRLMELWCRLKAIARELVDVETAIRTSADADIPKLTAKKNKALEEYGTQLATLRNMCVIRSTPVPKFSAEDLAKMPH